MTAMGCRLNAPRSVGILLAAVSILGASAQTAPSTSLSPTDLVRVTVQNEIKAANNPLSARHMFRSRKQTGHGSETKLFVETKDGMAGLLLATDDPPLTADQRQAEEMRVERFVNDPKELQRKH